MAPRNNANIRMKLTLENDGSTPILACVSVGAFTLLGKKNQLRFRDKPVKF